MKIAIIYSAHPPLQPWQQGDGGADYCQRLAQDLSSERDVVHVITSHAGSDCVPGSLSPGNGGVRIHRIISDWGPLGLFKGEYGKLRRALRAIHPDLLVVIFPGGGLGCRYILPALVKTMGLNCPVLTNVFGFFPGRAPYLLPVFLPAQVFLHLTSEKICFESVRDMRLFRMVLPFLRGKCAYIPTGATLTVNRWYDAKKTRINRAQLGLDPDTPTIAFLGGWTRNKNVELFLRAARRVLKTAPQTRILFIGGKEPKRMASVYEKRTLRLLEELQLADAVFFTGYVLEETLSQYLVSSDVCVFPFGGELGRSTLFLAMSAGMPIVTLGTQGHSFLRHQESAFLVSCRSEEILAEAVQTVLGDETLRERLSAGVKSAYLPYSREELASEWKALIRGFGREHKPALAESARLPET